MYVFSIFDEVAEDWSTPFCAKNIDHLKRLTSRFLNGGLVLDECVVKCLCRLTESGESFATPKDIEIFDTEEGYYFDFCRLTNLFAEELKKLEEVKKDDK